MILSDISVKRPVFAAVMNMLLVAFGIVAFLSLPVRELPDVDVPVVSVTTGYPGASASVVESRITELIEEQIAGIEGIDTVSSISRDGNSSITVQFDLSVNVDAAANDVRDRVSRVSRNLPEEADVPQVIKQDPDARSVLWFNLASPVMDVKGLTDYAERYIVDRLSVVPGVSRIQVGGGQRYAMRIWLDRVKLAARGLTVLDVENALRSENVELPAGSLESSERDFTVRVDRAYSTPEDFNSIPIRRGPDGHLIRLGEVAKVEIGSVEHRRIFRGNGEAMVGIGVQKQSTANTVEMAKAAEAEVERIRLSLPESMRIFQSFNSAVFVEEAINEVYRTLFISVSLVIMVIYLFLGSVRAALVPAVTVSVCLTSTFLVLGMFGYSINMMTLLALVLAIGLVVDDAIVVLENVYRRVERGEPGLLAAYRGAQQVAFAVIATTLVLVGVFLPILFLQDAVGRLFAELAVTLSAAVIFSSFVALTLSASLASILIRRRGRKNRLTVWMDNLFDRLGASYERGLETCFQNKIAIVLGLFCTVGVLAGLYRVIPSELTPQQDRGNFYVMLRGAEGAGFAYMSEKGSEIEAELMKEVEAGNINRLIMRIPGGFGGVRQMNSGMFVVNLTDWREREKTTEQMVADTYRWLGQVTGIRAFIIRSWGFGGGGGTPVEFVIGAPSYAEVAEFRDVVMTAAEANPGLVNVDADYKETQPQLRVEIDRPRAGDLGVSVRSIGTTLETMLGGKRVTTFLERGEEYDVMLRADDSDRRQPNDVANIFVRSERTGELIPLSNLVKIVERADSGELRRYNRVRAVTLTANLAPGYTLGEALDFLNEVVTEELPPSASVDYKGESKQLQEASLALAFTFAMAILVVFLILAAQFESFVHPLIILLTVPVALAGGLVGLYATGGTLNLYSQIGAIILVGLAAKNGILIVEFTNQMRDAGMEFKEAVIYASRVRLRPIIMTGLSTAMGSVPLILAMGAGSESRHTIGITVFSGVIFATFFTLFVVPTFYMLLAGKTTSPGAKAAKIAELEVELPRGTVTKPAE